MSESVEAPEASTSVQPPPPVVPNPYNKPVFGAANVESPTRDKLVTYTMAIDKYLM